MSEQKILLTPELAAKLLEGNVANRPMGKRYMQSLARAMQRGEWEFNGDAIRVARNGRLIDGQHRCAAVIESRVAIEVLLVTGLDEQVFKTIDRGRGRTTSDAMAIQGEKNARTLAAVARVLYTYQRAGDPYHGNPDIWISNPLTRTP